MLHLHEILPQLVASGSLAAIGYAVYAILRLGFHALSRMVRNFLLGFRRYRQVTESGRGSRLRIDRSNWSARAHWRS